jgi:hypothetical protein
LRDVYLFDNDSHDLFRNADDSFLDDGNLHLSVDDLLDFLDLFNDHVVDSLDFFDLDNWDEFLLDDFDFFDDGLN